MGFCGWSLCYYAVLSVLSSFAIILMRKRSWLLYFKCLPDVLGLLVLCLVLTMPNLMKIHVVGGHGANNGESKVMVEFKDCDIA